MTNRIAYIFAAVFLFLGSYNHALAQDSEKNLRAAIYTRLNNIYLAKEKSLPKENKKLMNYMLDICRHFPATLHMDFTGIKDDFFVVNSDDGIVRSYFWSTLIERSVFDVLLQFKVRDSVGVVVWNDAGLRKKGLALGIYTPSRIVSVHTNDNSTVYLVISDVRVGQSTKAEQVQAFVIDGYSLKEVPFFQTTKEIKSSIVFDYDPTFNMNYNIPATIHISDDKQKLYIPLKIAGDVKKNFLVYTFNGNNYVYDKNAN